MLASVRSRGAARGFVAAALLSCGACQPGPPSTLLQPPGVVTGLRFAVTPDQRLRGSTIDLAWSGGERAHSFLIEVGSSPGGADVAVFESRSPQPSFRWTAAPVGTFYLRVRARSELGTAAPSEEVRVDSVDPRHVIEALFLGSGPLAARREAPCDRRDRPSWRLDTPVVVRVSRDVPEPLIRGLEALRKQVPGATRGALWLTLTRENELDPRPRPGEFTVALTDDLSGEDGCPPRAAGCAIETVSGAVIESVRLLVRREHGLDVGLLARELAHTVFGLHHVEAPAGLRPHPLLDTRPPSTPDFEDAEPWEATTVRAIKAVYAAGLSAGASRHRFLAAGLIEPNGPVTHPAVSSGSQPVDRGRVVRPLCGMRADSGRQVGNGGSGSTGAPPSGTVP